MDAPTRGNCAEAPNTTVRAVVAGTAASDLASIPDALWAVARERFAAIEPLFEAKRFDSAAVI